MNKNKQKTFLRHLRNKKNPGENLIEVLVALAILAVVLTSTFALLARSTSANVNVKNRIMALNIAREGIEAVRNIRDTNWLKYSGNRRNKWLCLDTETIDCETIITPGFYTAESDTGYKYLLEKHAENSPANLLSPENIKDTPSLFDLYRLYSSENYINSGSQSSVNIPTIARTLWMTTPSLLNISKLYSVVFFEGSVHAINNDLGIRNIKPLTHNPALTTATPFFRQIELVPQKTQNCGDSECTKETELSVIVRVLWFEEETARTLTLETTLYDFLGRDSY